MVCFADDTTLLERETATLGRKQLVTRVLADWKENVHPGTMGEEGRGNDYRPAFFFRPPISVKKPGSCKRHANSGTSTDDGQDGWITLRRAVMRCAVLCCELFYLSAVRSL